ncbi:MAG: outer membrane beta-barrel protein [Phenylobacterium sp.]|jgi:hypothetical protein|uniref:outer membrane beta-barrel protein n=1 Tax=Phenylobacterium sp. TaxID=1871053 RepID=UPI003918CC2D
MLKPAILAGAALAWLFGAGLAEAQVRGGEGTNFSRGRSTSVRERPKPGYEAVGHRLGSFMVYPRVDLGVTFDDNIFATSTDEESDTVFLIEPRVDAVSNWSRHQVSATARARFTEYSDWSSESRADYTVGVNGRLDVDRSLEVTGRARYEKLTEPRSAIEAFQNLNEPVRYEVENYAAGVSKEFNRLRLNGTAEVSRYSFENARIGGAVAPQGYRDRTVQAFTGRVDYAVSPDTYVFLQGSTNKREYDLNSAVFGNRDSDGYDVAAGADFDLTNLIRGRVRVGYMEQTFDDAARFGKLSGLSAAGEVDYFLTQLTTVTVRASRGFQDSGLSNSAGYASTALGVQADHELLRNLILNARWDYERAEHEGIDRTDDRHNFSLGGTYLLNRALGLTASYSYFNQESSGLNRGFDFTINRVQLLLTLQY